MTLNKTAEQWKRLDTKYNTLDRRQHDDALCNSRKFGKNSLDTTPDQSPLPPEETASALDADEKQFVTQNDELTNY